MATAVPVLRIHLAPMTTPLHKARTLLLGLCLGLLGLLGPAVAQAPELAADAFIRRVSQDTLDLLKADKSLRTGDLAKVSQWVDQKLMPHVNFKRMTALSVGPAWRKATPEQQVRLQDEFKILLVRTYAGALSQIGDQSVVVKPLRAGQDERSVVVNTEIRGKGEVIPIDYRLEKAPGQGLGWLIFDLNVMGIWLVETYRTQFTQEINANGLDGLIGALAERNRPAPPAPRKN